MVGAMPEPAQSADSSVPLDRERDRPHPRQIELYRRATPTQKLAAVARLNATALDLKSRTPRCAPPIRICPPRAGAKCCGTGG